MNKAREIGRGTWDIRIPESITRLGDVERLVISNMLDRVGGNKAAAARLLGVYRRELYHKIRKYGIDCRMRQKR